MKNLKLLSTIVVMLICNTIIAQKLPEFGNRIDLGLIESLDLVEASGIVESRKNAHVLWSHNDRNHENRLFAMSTQGKHLGVYRIEGADNRDWEDIAIGPGPIEGMDYIYIGDIGDNYSEYDLKYIYRIPEPKVDFNQEPIEKTVYNVETITFQYPDGNRDSETLMLDPLTKDIYVVSKREFEDIRVYRARYPQSTTEVLTLEHVITLNLWQIVGGDISPSGLEILMKTYTAMYYWSRKPGQNLWQAFEMSQSSCLISKKCRVKLCAGHPIVWDITLLAKRISEFQYTFFSIPALILQRLSLMRSCKIHPQSKMKKENGLRSIITAQKRLI